MLYFVQNAFDHGKENINHIYYIHKYSFLRTFVPCKIAIPISYRQVLYSLHWITLIGWGTGWPRKVSRFGADGWLPRHRWLASWESEEKKKPHSLICFQYKWKIQTDGFALGLLFFSFFCFFSLSCEIYFISFEMFQGKHLCFESLNSSLS